MADVGPHKRSHKRPDTRPDTPRNALRRLGSVMLLLLTLAAFWLWTPDQDPTVLTDPLLDRYHDLLRAPGARSAMLARMRQTVLVDPLPLLHPISAPTLLLWGKQDGMIALANSANYLSALPSSRLVKLPGIGHLPQEEDPQRSLGPVRAFLAS